VGHLELLITGVAIRGRNSSAGFIFSDRSAVEEGKSMGKQVILSDIPGHREQDPPHGISFDPGNHRVLADALWRVWTSRDTGEEARWMKEADGLLPERRRQFAEQYEEIALEVVGSGR
jgi:hypothetical protein